MKREVGMGINENIISLVIQLSGRVPGFCPQHQTKRKRTKSVENSTMRPFVLYADLCLYGLLVTCGCSHLGTYTKARRRHCISSSNTCHLFFSEVSPILRLAFSPRLEVNKPQQPLCLCHTPSEMEAQAQACAGLWDPYSRPPGCVRRHLNH